MHLLKANPTLSLFISVFLFFQISKSYSDIVILNGPPGSGKGTQAKDIAKYLDYPLLSLGTLTRSGITDVSVSDSWSLSQPDQQERNLQKQKVVISWLQSQQEKSGMISDGWPRRKHAIDSFFSFIKSSDHRVLVFRLHIDDDQILTERARSRKVCPDPQCASSWGRLIRPPDPDICSCGKVLKTRFFDSQDRFIKRIQKYRKINKEDPFKDYANEPWFTLIEIPGDQSPGSVRQEIFKYLKRWKTSGQKQSSID